MSFTLDDDEEDFLTPETDNNTNHADTATAMNATTASASAPAQTNALASDPSFSLDDFVADADTAVEAPVAAAEAPVNTSFNIDEFLDSPTAPTPDEQPVPLDVLPNDAPLSSSNASGGEAFSIDDFLSEGSGSSPTAAPATAVDSATVNATESIPITSDPPSSATAVSPTATEDEPVVADSLVVPPPADDDFLSWLDDSTAATKNPPASIGAQPATKGSNVFDDSKDSSPLSSSLPPVTPYATGVSTVQKSQRKLKFESDLLKIITSGFPDIMKLQGLIAENGYIPRDLRGQVWCLLLSGTCSEDQEADFWQSTGLELPNHADVVSDCNAVIQKCRRRGLSLPSATLDQARRDMVDILVLYCVRRTIPYKSLYCDLLAPMLVTAKPLPKTVASSCFYSLCSEFIPVVNLSVLVQDRVSDKLHNMLRILLQYHYPKLCTHLDRVLKGWEQRTESISAAMAIQFDAAARDREEIDELERDFGVSLSTTVTPTTTTDEGASEERGTSKENPAAAENSHMQAGSTGVGKIPENWLYCIFGGSIPLDLSCWLWDWVLSSGDKFSGLYVVVSLFGLYSEALRGMTGSEISQWIETISKGLSDNWFTTLPIAFPDSNGGGCTNSSTSNSVANGLSWDSFIRGWLHAAEAIRHVTPTSFQASLNSIEKWAADTSTATTGYVGASMHGSASSASGGLDGSRGSSDMTGATDTATVPTASGSSLLIERLRRISAQMQKPATDGTASDGLRGRFSRALGAGAGSVDGGKEGNIAGNVGSFAGHDTPVLSDRCLWANVAEVVPCLCSSSKQRQAVPIERKVLLAFTSGAGWGNTSSGAIVDDGHSARGEVADSARAVSQRRPRSDSQTSADSSEGHAGDDDRGGEGFLIPLMAREKDQPFYFGIDCRAAANEISLGKFPKAYNLDPEDLKDSYLTSTVLRTLEPMASQVHFCLIGVGEEFFVHRAAVLAGKASKGQTAPTVDALRNEYYQGISTILDFFQKRDFKHVSFLEGGFTAAIRHLMKEECPYSISSSLVDVDPDALDAVIGTGTAASYLNSRRGGSGSVGSGSTAGALAANANSGSSGFLSSLSKADIFASSKSGNDGDVVEVAAPGNKNIPVGPSGSGLMSFMSSMKGAQTTGATPASNADASQVAAGGDNSTSSQKTINSSTGSSTTPSAAPSGDLKSKMSLFGSTTLASLRRVSQSVGSQAASSISSNGTSSNISSSAPSDDRDGTAASTSSSVSLGDGKNKQGRRGGDSQQHIQRESSAFVIDDDEEEEEAAEGNTIQPSSASDKSKASSFITRVGGAIRSSSGQVDQLAPPLGGISGSFSRLQGGGLVDIDPDKIGVSKTDAEKAQALAMHKLAGVRKGDSITINRESLPGALLFPARKIKMVSVDRSTTNVESNVDTNTDTNADVEQDVTAAVDNGDVGVDSGTTAMKEIQLHRYIVVTKERVIVLDSGGGGVGSVSTVKSNHHLTELVKLTFKKKDLELITLFVANTMPGMPDDDDDDEALDQKQRGAPAKAATVPPKQKQYRVSKRDELVDVLQKYMKRFR